VRRKRWWRPRYEVRVRKQGDHGFTVVPAPYDLESPCISECPVSIITQDSIDLVYLVNSLMSVNKSAGANIPALDLPGRVFDALQLGEIENRIREVAMDEAVANA
jgi:hypothetical protein